MAIHRHLGVVPALLLLAGLLLGCTLVPTLPVTPIPTAVPSPTPPPPSPTPDPRVGGRLNVRLSQNAAPLTPLRWVDDGEAAWLMDLLYGGLTRLDDQLRPRPDLAESWIVSPDGLVITFTLRPELHWSDGTPLSSADVRFSWDRLGQWAPRTAAQANLREYVAAVRAPAADTVVFVLHRRLAGLLTDAAWPILPQHVWGDLSPQELAQANLLEQPVCSGPFRPLEHRPGQALVLERNPEYYGEPAYLEQVALLVAPDPEIAELALRRGDLHLALLPRQTYRALQQLPSSRPLRLERYARPQYTFVAFNLRPGHPLEDVRLRQAWAYALDKDLLVTTATDGAGIPLWSPILPHSWAYARDLPRLDENVGRARELLAEAGWRDEDGDGIVEKEGQSLQVRLLVRPGFSERIAACRRMAGSLAAAGIGIEIVVADFESVIQASLRPPYDFDALLMQWRDLGPDPDLFYLFHSSQAWQGEEDTRENLYNVVGYRNEQADRLIMAGRESYDLDEREAAYEDLQQLLAVELPYYMLWGDPFYVAAAATIYTDKGPPNLASPRLFWNVERWYWAKE